MFASEIDAHTCWIACRHPDRIEPLLGGPSAATGPTRWASLFATLADPSRARIVHVLALSKQELCVCDIALVLGMSVSALSHQLRYLHKRGAVARRKMGRIVFYRLVDDHLRQLVLDAAVHVAEVM